MQLKPYLYILVLIIAVNVIAGDKTTKCNFLNVDSTLNKVYKQVLTEYKADTLFVRKFKESQRLWVKFRDAHLESIFPTAGTTDKNIEYGSMYSDCACDVLSGLTKTRILQLQKWIDMTVEGDGCAGSYKVK